MSEELGVRYVLEGSVQRSDDRVRITAQLVDALTENQLFAERYDSESTDLFALQDELTIKVLGSIMKMTNLSVASEWMAYSKDAHGLECFLKYQEGLGILYSR